MITMRSVGQILKQARESKQLSFEAIEQATKIKASYLKAIETGSWSELPPPTFTKGLIRNYAKHLELDAEEIVAIFRREFDERRTSVSMPKLAHIDTWFHFTPTTVLRIALAIIILLFAGYFFREYRILTGPPALSVKSPNQNEVITSDTVVVQGKTSPEATLTINDQPVLVNADGSFQTTIDLSADTAIRIKAIGKSGKSTMVERMVLVKKP